MYLMCSRTLAQSLVNKPLLVVGMMRGMKTPGWMLLGAPLFRQLIFSTAIHMVHKLSRMSTSKDRCADCGQRKKRGQTLCQNGWGWKKKMEKSFGFSPEKQADLAELGRGCEVSETQPRKYVRLWN